MYPISLPYATHHPSFSRLCRISHLLVLWPIGIPGTSMGGMLISGTCRSTCGKWGIFGRLIWARDGVVSEHDIIAVSRVIYDFDTWHLFCCDFYQFFIWSYVLGSIVDFFLGLDFPWALRLLIL